MNRRRNKEEEDSGSDWDSMSEIGPPPSLKHGPQANGPSAQSLPPIQARERTAMHVEPQVDVMPAKENPPYNFKAEVRSPTHASGPLPKPGKQKKGKMYDPPPASQKHVTFVGSQGAEQGVRFNGGGPDSDSEDPLYSTVKPKHRAEGNGQHPVSAEPDKREVLGKPKKTARNTPPHPSQKPFEGIDNHGYVEEDVSGSLGGPCAGSPQVTLKTPLPTFSESYFDHINASKSHDSQIVMKNNIATTKECPPPLIMSSGEALLESAWKRPVDVANRALGEVFALITLPFTCLTLFLHHLIRFILQGVVRPLVVDSLRLVLEYIVQPFTSGVLKPLLVTVHVASVGLSDTVLVCVRPLIALLQSVRLVEVHYTSRYSVEEV